MSGGVACKCPETTKPIAERAWGVLDYRCNHSAFSGYRYVASAYSSVMCKACGAIWRTKAAYVDKLPFADIMAAAIGKRA